MSRTSSSKFLSFVLRHRPDAANISLDAGGWVSIPDLLAGSTASGMDISREELDAIVAGSDKQRFSIRGEMIRANQGHSVSVDLGLARKRPPTELYHGTTTDALDVILQKGLHKMARHHVHLSSNVDTARRVGARHGRPVVLQVDALSMSADGAVFFVSENGIWLVDVVPPKYITRFEPS